MGYLFPIYGKIKNVPNHQPGMFSFFEFAMLYTALHDPYKCFPISMAEFYRQCASAQTISTQTVMTDPFRQDLARENPANGCILKYGGG